MGLVFDQIRWEEKAILETAKNRGVTVNLIDAKDSTFPLIGDEAIYWDVILQRCASYFRNLHSTAILESRGYTVINNFQVSLVCGNKLFTTLALLKAGVPTPRTHVAFTSEAALKALDEVGYPAILKPVVGSWGRFIVPLKDRETAKAVFEEREYMYPLYQVYYIQEVVERPPRDLRVFVVGDEVAAAIYRYSFVDMKTNIAKGGKAEECRVTNEIRELGIKVARAVGGGILGVDMMETKEGLLVHEVNPTVEFQATVSATKVDIPEYIIGYLLVKARR
ncbi:MAG: lysine biosynthesis protein LysX [Candidatus Bathyarchaeia archaeon]